MEWLNCKYNIVETHTKSSEAQKYLCLIIFKSVPNGEMKWMIENLNDRMLNNYF